MSVYIIAEAGVNHDGSLEKALKLVDYACQAGCDCVKFQLFDAGKLVTGSASKAKYQIENTGTSETQFQMLKKLELGGRELMTVRDYCREKGIDFLVTPFDETTADQTDAMEVESLKVSSGDITNKPFLKHLARKGKKILLSTGMSTMEEVEKAVGWITEEGNRDIVLFHCTSNYPAPYDSVNMLSMKALEKFGFPVGYSDHTRGIEIPVMAAAMGAAYLEKHFTYDREADGPDHKASLNPEELKAMVQAVRHVEAAFGDGIKRPAPSELATREVARKSLIWANDVPEGALIRETDICCKRPGTGIPPEDLEQVVGRKAARDCRADELVDRKDFV